MRKTMWFVVLCMCLGVGMVDAQIRSVSGEPRLLPIQLFTTLTPECEECVADLVSNEDGSVIGSVKVTWENDTHIWVDITAPPAYQYFTINGVPFDPTYMVEVNAGTTEFEFTASTCAPTTKKLKSATLPWGLGANRYLRMRVSPAVLSRPGQYFFGTYLAEIDDPEDTFDGGWPVYSLDRDGYLEICDGSDPRGLIYDCYNYFTTLVTDFPFSDEIAAQVGYLIETGFVGTGARNCLDENGANIIITAAHVQEAIWTLIEEGTSDDCVVNELIGYAREYAVPFDECGPRYRLVGLMPEYAFSHHGFRLMMLGFVVHTDVPCCVPSCPTDPDNPYLDYCGWQPDGCGDIIWCGECECVAIPPECYPNECGPIQRQDNCGGWHNLDCGPCDCTAPKPQCEIDECGEVRKQDECGEWHTLDCGPCDDPCYTATATVICEPEEEEGDEWCSPGWWKNNGYPWSWVATGYSPEQYFYDVFGYYPVGKEGCETNPTLYEVVSTTNCYTGEEAEVVADRLSEAHPDINFSGEEEDRGSCPLSPPKYKTVR